MANAFGSFRSRDSQGLGLPDDQSILPLRSDHFIFSIPDSEPNSPAGSGIDSGSGAIATTQQSLVGADLLDAASVAALTGQDAAAAEYQTAGDLDSAGANAPAATIAASMRAKAGFQNESDNGLHLTAHEVGFSWGECLGARLRWLVCCRRRRNARATNSDRRAFSIDRRNSHNA